LLSLPEDSVENLEHEAMKRGINPKTRLIFTPRSPKADHLERMALYADLFLDTPRFNAHTSAVDALWAGVPLLTVPDELMIGRVSASLLTAARVPELIASDLAQYEEIAVSLAKDPSRYEHIRKKVLDGRRYVFDTADWTRRFEKGLKLAWQTRLQSSQ
jgi:predicted O-linked N-acetylglucosamine transferase (SPINDLY family)